MSEKRYEVKEGQLRDLFIKYSTTQLTVRELVSTLTPLPDSPVSDAQVVERIKAFLHEHVLEFEDQQHGFHASLDQVAESFAALITAEATRQVDERTSGLEVALSLLCEAVEDEKSFKPMAKRLMSVDRALKIARQALANKGGSDE